MPTTQQHLDRPQKCDRGSRVSPSRPPALSPSSSLRPWTPMAHCPQCDGPIDPRCIRTTPVKSDRPNPVRQVEAFCDFCTVGFRARYELAGRDGWTLIDSVKVLRGDAVRNLRTFAEEQMNVTGQ